MPRFYCNLAVIALFLSIGDPLFAQQPPALFRNVALISATPETDELRDLLLAEMSRKNFQLVGRQTLLTDWAKEIQLQTLTETTNNATRTEVGGLIRADVLVIFRQSKLECGPSVEVVFAETITGTRLDRMTLRDDDAEVLIPLIIDEAIRLRERFADGIRQIVAVPPFVSNNLSHDFDDLQSTISHYLAEVLRQTPGIVVVEFEEANSILAENALHADDTNRAVPLMVNGNFEVGPAPDRTINVSVTLDQGDSAAEVNGAIKMENTALGAWLRNQVAAKIVSKVGLSVSGMSPSEQVKKFVQNADMFASLGDVDRAISLREAALVLDPRNLSQRKQLVREYSTHPDQIWATPRHVRHFEFLARNNMLTDRMEVRRLFLLKRRIPHFDGRRPIDVPQQVLLDEVRFCAIAARAWKSLSDGTPSPLDIERLESASGKAYPWWSHAAGVIWQNFSKSPSAEILQLHADFVQHYSSNELPTASLAIPYSQFNSHGLPKLHLDLVARKDWDGYFDRLERSSNPNARFCGTLGRIYYFLWQARAVRVRIPVDEYRRLEKAGTPGQPVKLSESDEALLRESIESFFRQLDSIKKLEETDQSDRWEGWSLYRRRSNYYGFLEQIKSVFAGVDVYFPDEKYSKRLPVIDDPFKLYGESVPRKEIVRDFGRLNLEEIDLKIEGRLPKLEKSFGAAGLRDIVDCETFDVLWTQSRVFLMKRPGILEPVNIPRWYAHDAENAHVSWDGRFVWLAGASTRSLFVIDSANWQVHEIQVLPEKSRMKPEGWNSISARCVGPGKAIVVGSFGKHHRTWCALVTISIYGSELLRKIDVFHTARVVPGFSDPEKTDLFDPDLAFRPGGIALYELEDGGRRVLVQRRTGMYGQVHNASSYPLMIDFDRKKVSVLKRNMWMMRDNSLWSRKGDLFVATGWGDRLYKADAPENSRPLILGKKGGRRLIHHDGWLYSCGFNNTWERINIETLKVEPLATLMPHPHTANVCAISAHYGLVAFSEHGSSAYGDPDADLATATPKLYSLTVNNKHDGKQE